MIAVVVQVFVSLMMQENAGVDRCGMEAKWHFQAWK
jgi:hypothetical protein